MQKPRRRQVNASLPVPLWEKLDKRAAEQGLKISTAALEIIEKALADPRPKPEPPRPPMPPGAPPRPPTPPPSLEDDVEMLAAMREMKSKLDQVHRWLSRLIPTQYQGRKPEEAVTGRPKPGLRVYRTQG
jgi:hypothetical protein